MCITTEKKEGFCVPKWAANQRLEIKKPKNRKIEICITTEWKEILCVSKMDWKKKKKKNLETRIRKLEMCITTA